MEEIHKALKLAQSGENAVLTFPEGTFVIMSWEKYCEMTKKNKELTEKDKEYLNYMGE